MDKKKLKTLKDFGTRTPVKDKKGFALFSKYNWVKEDELKAEAIKRVKFGKNPNGDQQIFTREEWMDFFNITEEDLKKEMGK